MNVYKILERKMHQYRICTYLYPHPKAAHCLSLLNGRCAHFGRVNLLHTPSRQSLSQPACRRLTPCMASVSVHVVLDSTGCKELIDPFH